MALRTKMMMKLPILPCAEKLELVLSTAPKTADNTDKNDSASVYKCCRKTCGLIGIVLSFTDEFHFMLLISVVGFSSP